jgi:DNA-directed RNA polymerase subunit RPC12/RpoP
MPVSVQCPICGASVSIADQAAGKRVQCPHCQKNFLAPGVTGSQNDDDDWLQLDAPPASEPVGTKPSTQRPRPTRSQPAGSQSETGDDSLFDELDEFTAATESPPAPKPVSTQVEATPVEYATEYRVRCNVCDSLMFAKASQAGKTVKCSDCHSPITIPPPPKVKKKQTMDLDSAQTFALEQPRTVRRKDTDPNRKSAEQLLAEAAKSEEESQPVRYSDTPNVVEWLSGVFGIFRDISVITHWVGLSILAAVPTVAVIAINHPYFYAMMVPAGLFFGALVVSCGFAILQSVANGEKEVSNWPILDPSAWLGELVVAVTAAAIVAAPVAAISHIMNAGLIGVALTMLAIYGLFPFVLLSMMDMNSALKPFSAEVARSVTKCEEAWGGFYFSSGVLFAALFLLIVVGKTMGALGIAVAVFASVGVAFIYFAMIGRLAFAIGQAVNAPPRKKDPEPTQQNDSQ